MIKKEDVKHIAQLARLGLSEKEAERFQKELSSVLDYFKKLEKVDISGVSLSDFARQMRGDKNVTRDDITGLSNKETLDEQYLKSKKLIDMAPETKNGFLKVKSVFKKK